MEAVRHECVICCEDVDPGRTLKLPCKHCYHGPCLQAWAERGAVTSTSDPRGTVLPAKRQEPTQPAHAGRYAC